MQYIIFPRVFISQVVELARQIAMHQRGTRELQGIEVLIEKYEKEVQELNASSAPEEEWPDVIYYACQLAYKGHRVYLSQVENCLDESQLFSLEDAMAITLAKYRLRAAGPNSKDFQREREAIQAALR